MACGAGVQYLAERFTQIPLFPASIPMVSALTGALGIYGKKMPGCGECVLAYTGGICPVTRCAKGSSTVPAAAPIAACVKSVMTFRVPGMTFMNA